MEPGGLRIVAVDDEDSLLQLLKIFLTRQGHQVTPFNHPLNALEWFRQEGEAAQLAIVDLTMPVLPGEELAREMLTLHPTLKVLLSSGYPYDTAAMGQFANRVGFLSKPFVPRELQSAIASLFP